MVPAPCPESSAVAGCWLEQNQVPLLVHSLPPLLPDPSQRASPCPKVWGCCFAEHGEAPGSGLLPGWAPALICHIHLMSRPLAGSPASSLLGTEAEGEMEARCLPGTAEKKLTAAHAPGLLTERETLACSPGDDFYMKTNRQTHRQLSCPVFEFGSPQALGFPASI